MFYSEHAFEKDEKEQAEKIWLRYKKIEHLEKDVEMHLYPQCKHDNFLGKTLTEEADNLSEMDILILADRGHLPFGGKCEKFGKNFSGTYYTD